MAVRSSFVCCACGSVVLASADSPVVYVKGKRYHYACFMRKAALAAEPEPLVVKEHKKEKPAFRLVLKGRGKH